MNSGTVNRAKTVQIQKVQHQLLKYQDSATLIAKYRIV